METGTTTIQLTDAEPGASDDVGNRLPTAEICLTPTVGGALPPLPPLPSGEGGRNPGLLYLASLLTRDSRRSQRMALAVVARLFGYRLDTMPWHGLAIEHTMALRA